MRPVCPLDTPRMRPDDPLDTFLLRVLCTVLTERSVSRAAVRLNYSQPAISAALRRLREVFSDPLLIRDKAGMVPTERGAQLLASAQAVLADIDRLLAPPVRFDPAQAQWVFRVGSPDYLVNVFLADVVRALRRDSPGSRFELVALGPDYDSERALAEGRLDIVIGNWPDPPGHLHASTLLEDDVVCLCCGAHAWAGRAISAEQYLQAAHVAPAPYSVSHRGVVESHLARLRLKRHVAVVVPFFAMAPHLLPGTDLVFTTSRHFAQHYARLLPLALVEAPFDFPRMRFYQLWHDRTHQSSAHRWLRALLAEAGRRIARPGEAG